MKFIHVIVYFMCKQFVINERFIYVGHVVNRNVHKYNICILSYLLVFFQILVFM